MRKLFRRASCRQAGGNGFAHGRQFEIRTRRPGPQPLPLRRHSRCHPRTSAPSTPGTPASLEELRPQIHDSATDLASRGRIGSRLRARRRLGSLHPPRTPTRSGSRLLAELIEAEVPESAARELMESLRQRHLGEPLDLATLRDALVANAGPLR